MKVFDEPESPSQRLRRCQPPLARGPLEQDRGPSSTQAPLAKGGCPRRGRGDSVYRKSVGRGAPGAPFSGSIRSLAGGFRQAKRLYIMESPSHRLRRRQPPLARGPLEQDRSLQAPKPPLLKGGAPAGGGGISSNETMKQRRATTYTLQKYGVSSSSIRRIKDGDSISTNTIDALCEILNCSVNDIIEYIPNQQKD